MTTPASLSRAELLVAQHVTAHQAELDVAAVAARAAFIAALRTALSTETPGSTEAERELCTAVATHVTVGRADGFPAIETSTEARELIRQAVAAGVLRTSGQGPRATVYVGQIGYYSDLSGIEEKGPVASAAWRDDYAAWDAATRYRATNGPVST